MRRAYLYGGDQLLHRGRRFLRLGLFALRSGCDEARGELRCLQDLGCPGTTLFGLHLMRVFEVLYQFFHVKWVCCLFPDGGAAVDFAALSAFVLDLPLVVGAAKLWLLLRRLIIVFEQYLRQ